MEELWGMAQTISEAEIYGNLKVQENKPVLLTLSTID
jgi:hypothetical protein